MAPTDTPILDALARRYSPRAFADTPVTAAEVRTLIEAARWASSCFNAQPWRYIVAMRGDRDGFAAMVACLMEGNRQWADKAAVLMLSVAELNFARNDKANRHALHDVGQATANLAIQAASMGLQIHQMAGFDADKARSTYAIPEGYEPVAAIAVGYPGAADSLPEGLRQKELASRERKSVDEWVFGGSFGTPHVDLAGSKGT